MPIRPECPEPARPARKSLIQGAQGKLPTRVLMLGAFRFPRFAVVTQNERVERSAACRMVKLIGIIISDVRGCYGPVFSGSIGRFVDLTRSEWLAGDRRWESFPSGLEQVHDVMLAR
jgi:hypothetical protein